MVIAQVGGLAADQAIRVSGYWEGVFLAAKVLVQTFFWRFHVILDVSIERYPGGMRIISVVPFGLMI